MLRDKSLITLSRQHQHALALCVRIDRALQAGTVDLEAWQSEIQQIFEQEVGIHFAAEEKALFPVAREVQEVEQLVDELLAEHTALRDFFARSTTRHLTSSDLPILVEKLSQHIRKEERQLFEGLQKVMSAEELATLGAALERELEGATKACSLPNPATKLRPHQ
jgi:hemerythrin-like domain-containing protein